MTVTKMSLNNVPWVSLKTETLHVTVQCGYLDQWATVSLMFAWLEALFQGLLITSAFHLILKQEMVKYKLLYFTTSVRNTGDPWRQFYNTEKAKPLWALPKIITFQRTEFSNIFKYYKHWRIQSLINLKILYGYEINIMNSNYTTTLTKDCQINKLIPWRKWIKTWL